MEWQSDKTHMECMRYMLDLNVATDVTFLLGEGKDPVHAHKFVLISRSPVFFYMFEGLLSEKGDVVISDIDKDIFKEFLRYLYTDTIELNNDSIFYVLCTARKYCVDILVDICLKYLKKNKNVDNVCFFLEMAHSLCEEMIASDCMEFIKDHPTQCVRSAAFTDLCHDCLLNIADSDDIDISENIVYEAVMRWSECECQRNHIEVNNMNKRKVLSNILDSIRFPFMEKSSLERDILSNNLLVSDKCLMIQSSLSGNNSLRKTFKNYARMKTAETQRYQKKCLKLQRFPRWNESWYQGGRADAISFKVSETMYFRGIGLYGCNDDKANYRVSLDLLDQTDTCICHTLKTIYTDDGTDIYDVIVDTPPLLQPNVFYTVSVSMAGPRAKRGIDGENAVTVQDITVVFANTCQSRGGTNVDYGQIPVLLLTTK